MSEIQTSKLTAIVLSGYLGFIFFGELRIVWSYYDPYCFPTFNYLLYRIFVFHMLISSILLGIILNNYLKKAKDIKNKDKIRLWSWLSWSLSLLSGLFWVMYYHKSTPVNTCPVSYTVRQQQNGNDSKIKSQIKSFHLTFWLVVLLLSLNSSFYFVLLSELLK